MDCSLIVPCYNEAKNLPAFFAAATAAFDAHGLVYELVFVNDGSADDTARVLAEEVSAYRARGGDASVVVLEFSRNFGKEAALFAGLERSRGDYVCFIDADMQQDPATALHMLSFLRSNDDYDCVAAVQQARRESLPLRLVKRTFYKLFNDMSEMSLIENASDFRVFTRQVADALLSLREHFRFTKGLFSWVGFKTYAMPYEANERLSGKSKWTLRALLRYAWDGVLAFSTWPIRAVMGVGIVLAIVSVPLLGWDLYATLSAAPDVSSSQVMLDVVLLLSGLQLLAMGVFGEYMARAYVETKGRPLYIMRREHTYQAFTAGGRPARESEAKMPRAAAALRVETGARAEASGHPAAQVERAAAQG